MNHHAQPSSPPALRQRGVTRDNLTLVPASLLPQKARYQAIANRLPPGEVLLVLPEAENRQRQTLLRAARFFRAKGRRVRLLRLERLQLALDRTTPLHHSPTSYPSQARPTGQAIMPTDVSQPMPAIAPLPPATRPSADDLTSAARSFTLCVRFASIDPEQNRARFYDLQWQPALWGGGGLIRAWGRLGGHGQRRVDFFPTRHAAQAAIDRLLRERLTHGYQLVAWQ